MPPKLDYCFITSTDLVTVTFYSDLHKCSIAGLRNETEADNNTASTFLEHARIIDHTFRLHKCACTVHANIKVGVAAKLGREKFNFKCATNERKFEHLNLFPSPNMYTCTCIHLHVHVHVYVTGQCDV